MSEVDDHILGDFLADCEEGLDRFDLDLVELERDPASPALGSAFRTLHTLKGSCAFLGFHRLERLAHAGETLLVHVRSGTLAPSPGVTAALLATGDAVRAILADLVSSRREPAGDDAPLVARLEAFAPGEGANARATASAAADESAPAASPGDGAAPVRNHVRVDTAVLDLLVDQVGELVLARNQLGERVARGDWPAVTATLQRLDHVTTGLQDATLSARMLPVSTLWTRLPRLVHDTAAACGKAVALELNGTQTELDRTLVEALKDPLTHLVRNAIDHGIEPAAERRERGKPSQGKLVLRAWHEGGNVQLEVQDDGAGIDVERIRAKALAAGRVTPAQAAQLSERDWLRMVFEPGFSTAERVTTVSGRGVGMDVVRASVERVGGTVEIESRPGHGTTVRLRLPLTLAILPALLLEDGGERYALPHSSLVELVRTSAAELPSRLEWLRDTPAVRLRGELLPVVFLAHALRGIEPRAARARTLVVLRAGSRVFALAAEDVHDTEEIVVKPIVSRLRAGVPFSGATLLGDGRIALILDVAALAVRAGLGGETAAVVQERTARTTATQPQLLLVAAHSGVMAAVPLEGLQRIDELPAEAFLVTGPVAAARWRDGVLPVAALTVGPDETGTLRLEPGRFYPVLIVEWDGAPHGLVANSIADIVASDEALAVGGRALLGGHLACVVDLAAAARRVFEPAERSAA